MNIRPTLTIGGVVYPPVLVFRGALMAKDKPKPKPTGPRPASGNQPKPKK